MNKVKNIAFAAITTAITVVPNMAMAAATTSGDLIGSAGSSGLATGGGNNLSDYVNTIISYVIALVGLIAILGFLISAVMYFTAAGDEEKITKAKSAMTYSIVGVVVALVGFVIMNLVQDFLQTTAI